jgi:hypothetical protein
MKFGWRALSFTLFATLSGCGSGSSEYEVEHDGGGDGGGRRNDAGQLVDDAGRPIDSGSRPTGDSGTGAPVDSGGLPGVDSGSGGTGDSGGVGVDSGPTGGPITCSNPGTYKMNGGACGSERWDVKTGTDPYTGMVSLVPVPTTIATLVGLAAAGGGTMRESPTETTLWELKDVTLTELKSESDSDYHLVISDGTNTMIAEIPYPTCATGSPWLCFMENARSEIDAKYSVGSSPQTPAATITLRGVGFFDFKHGQNGVAPNAIELHPLLQICFGQGCTPS